jgi:uncharacterized protein (TIGR02186 family)
VIALLRLAASCLTALVLECSFAAAEQLTLTLAPDRISIASSYSGSSIVVFGAIRTNGASPHSYNVIVTVVGPRQTVVARRKERMAGIWLNQGSRIFVDIPSFFGVFANRPLEAIANADTLRLYGIGLKNALFMQQGNDENELYLENLIGIRIDEKLYSEQARAVTFISPTAFRVDIPLPKNVLVGPYNIELKLFSNGAVIAQATSTFNVVKVGVEEYVVKASVDNSLIYGLATAAMALLTGWLASIAFRRD